MYKLQSGDHQSGLPITVWRIFSVYVKLNKFGVLPPATGIRAYDFR